MKEDNKMKVIKLRDYVKEEDLQHVTYRKSFRTQIYKCRVCGPLPVVDGVVVHTKPDEDHDFA